MQFIQNHIITIITLSLISGILVGVQQEWSPAFLYILIGIVIIKAAISFGKKQDQKALRCAVVLFFLIGITSITNIIKISPNDLSNLVDDSTNKTQVITVQGKINDVPVIARINQFTMRTTITLKVDKAETDKKVTGISQVNIYYQAQDTETKNSLELLKEDDKIEVAGKIRKIRGYQNPSNRYSEIDQQRKQITTRISARPDEIKIIKIGEESLSSKLAKKLDSIKAVMKDTMPKDTRGILIAMIFGQRESIDPQILKDFSVTGIIHIISISGAHIAIVAGALSVLCTLLRFPKVVTITITLIGIISYAVIGGLGAPIIRATIMGSVTLLAVALNREKDSKNALTVTALIMLLYDSALLYNISFQLSFSATAGIIYFYEIIKQKLSFLPKPVKEIFSITISAQIGSLPFLIWYFNSISIIALLGNLIIIPIVEIALITGLLGCIVVGVSAISGKVLFIFSSLLLNPGIWLSAMLAQIPFGTHYVPSIGITGSLTYYFLIFVLYKYGLRGLYEKTLILIKVIQYKTSTATKRFVVILLIIIFSTSLLISVIFTEKQISVHFIDVGQGNASLIIGETGKAILIDTGGSTSPDFDIGERVVVPYLKYYGVHEIEYLILTHGHQDHAGGAAGIATNMKVKNIILPKHDDSLSIENLLKADTNKIVIIAQEGQEIKVDGVTIKIEMVDDDTVNIKSLNERSNIVRIIYKDHNFLFTGDLEKRGERKMLQKGIKEVDVLSIGHHGSKTSSAEEFLKTTMPDYAVISVGYKNRFGHPHDEIIERLDRHGIKTYRTDISGAVVFYSNGKILKSHTYTGL